MSGENVAAFIPARGGSSRLPRKNLASIAGRTLLERAIASGLACSSVTVSTNDRETRAAAEATRHEVRIHARPAHMSSDTSDVCDAVHHWLGTLATKPDAVLVLNPTSPFRRVEHVEAARALISSGEWDSIASVTVGHEPAFAGYLLPSGELRPWRGDVARPRTQDVRTMCWENGAVFGFRVSWFERSGGSRLLGGRAGALPMARLDSLDIDTAEDLAMARALAGCVVP